MQWIEIDKSALVSNISQFRRLVGEKTKLLAVVKANAYGHGLGLVSQIALEAGVDWLGVNSVEEGVFLRRQEVKCPILILGYTPLNKLHEAVSNQLHLTVYNFETLDKLARVCQNLQQKAYLNLKIETGTYRQGIRAEDLLPFTEKANRYPQLVLEGISSHFANIEDTTDHSYAQQQLENFRSILNFLERHKVNIPLKHMSCTAAAILFPETYFKLVRIGIGMYGLWPSRETYLSSLLKHKNLLKLKPVLSWKARVAQIKKVPKDSFIGYGCTYRTNRLTELAVLPVGYYDGYRRHLSNSGYVLIKGQRAPVRGRVAMNFIIVDITDIAGVRLEEEAVLIGQSGQETITADYLASLMGTINYEVVTSIGAHLPRLVV